jgi:hypothetical protein
MEEFIVSVFNTQNFDSVDDNGNTLLYMASYFGH